MLRGLRSRQMLAEVTGSVYSETEGPRCPRLCVLCPTLAQKETVVMMEKLCVTGNFTSIFGSDVN